MKCDVIIPFFNRHDTIVRAIGSVVHDHLVARVIVVDDYSSPPLNAELFHDVADGSKISILGNDRGKGAQNARISGILASTADVLVFLDSDDELLPGAIERLLLEVDSQRSKALFYGDILFGSRRVRFQGGGDGPTYREILRNLSLCPFSGMCVRRSAIDVEALISDIPAWQDDDFVLSVAQKHLVHQLAIPVARMHLSTQAISRSKCRQFRGLVMLLAKWEPEIRTQLGLVRLFLWRLRLIRLRMQCFSEELALRSKGNGKVNAVLIKTIAWAIKLLAGSLYVVLRPFFYRIYA